MTSQGKNSNLVSLLESHNIEVNIRFLPFCVISEKYRKNIQNSLQMIYDNHEWEPSSRLWIDRPAQRQAKALIEKRKGVYYLFSRIKFSRFLSCDNTKSKNLVA